MRPRAREGELIRGRYRLDERIGLGGTGTVYLSTDEKTQQRVVVKVLDSRGNDPFLGVRFLREARAFSRLRHPNIVEVYSAGQAADGTAYLVMEYIEGEDLAKVLIRHKRLPWPRVKRIVLQILDALSCAHQSGVIHRDMKLENCIRVAGPAGTDVIKVLDFGNAKEIDRGDQPAGRRTEGWRELMTAAGVVVGTAAYMSPEQAQQLPLDQRADLYSVGVILFEMITGRLPFDAPTFMGVLNLHINEWPPSPRQVAPELGISRQLERVMLRLLAKDPEHRYFDCEAAAAAIGAIDDDDCDAVSKKTVVVDPAQSVAAAGEQDTRPDLAPGGKAARFRETSQYGAPKQQGQRRTAVMWTTKPRSKIGGSSLLPGLPPASGPAGSADASPILLLSPLDPPPVRHGSAAVPSKGASRPGADERSLSELEMAPGATAHTTEEPDRLRRFDRRRLNRWLEVGVASLGVGLTTLLVTQYVIENREQTAPVRVEAASPVGPPEPRSLPPIEHDGGPTASPVVVREKTDVPDTASTSRPKPKPKPKRKRSRRSTTRRRMSSLDVADLPKPPSPELVTAASRDALPKAPAAVADEGSPDTPEPARLLPSALAHATACGPQYGGLSGERVVATLGIDGDGRVERVSVAGRRLTNGMADCVEHALRGVAAGETEQTRREILIWP